MKNKIIWIIVAVLCLVAGGLFALISIKGGTEVLPTEPDPSTIKDIKVFETEAPETEPMTEPVTEAETEIATEPVTEAQTEPVTEATTEEPETEPVTETEAVTPETEAPQRTEASSYVSQRGESKLDFSALQSINPDIIAWIQIDGTVIDYPILQNAYNDKKYLTTYYDGSYYVGGSLFTEHTYNATDFNDPVTIIYGHYMRSGALFGSLQKTYSQKYSFDEHTDIRIYLPGEVRHYTVFAAVPFETYHILHAYDFSRAYYYKAFFKDVSQISAIGAVIDQSKLPSPDDRVIILSTCLNGDSSARYLVMAVCNDDLS